MYNKTIIEFGFCDMRNYQGLGKCYRQYLLISAYCMDNYDLFQNLCQNC